VRKKRKEVFFFLIPDSSFVGCGAVSTGKSRISVRNIIYVFRIEQWRNKGNLFEKKNAKLCLLYQNEIT